MILYTYVVWYYFNFNLVFERNEKEYAADEYATENMLKTNMLQICSLSSQIYKIINKYKCLYYKRLSR